MTWRTAGRVSLRPAAFDRPSADARAGTVDADEVATRRKTMQVHEVMTEPPQTCPQTMHLADASRRMRASGCGCLIVLGADGRIAGIVTDRDLALALGQDRDAARLTLERVMARHVHRCRPGDDLAVALHRMATSRVRRLPVVNADGDGKGLISIDDIVLWGLQSRGVSTHDLLVALRALCASSSSAAREYAERLQPS